MKKKHLILAALVICLSTGVAWAAVKGVTSISMTSLTKVGDPNGPWAIKGGGKVSLDSSVTEWIGLQFYATITLDGVLNTRIGFTNLPNGPPAIGGDAVSWTGEIDGIKFPQAGTYTAVGKASYKDANNEVTKMTVSKKIDVL